MGKTFALFIGLEPNKQTESFGIGAFAKQTPKGCFICCEVARIFYKADCLRNTALL